jgi:GNAT superfamily N-acetyltransferase
MIDVLPVSAGRVADAYVDLPWQIYKDDPCWVPPLRKQVRATMDAKRNPFFRHAEVEHYVAFNGGGAPVGRIAVTIYPVESGARATDWATFGFFESVDDPEVATALFQSVEQWATKRGLAKIKGPYNYCSTQECGLLIDGFTTPPAVFQTHNPPYYMNLIEGCGYREMYSMATLECGAAEALELASREERPLLDPKATRAAIAESAKSLDVTKRAENVARLKQITVRPLRMKDYKAEMETICRLFNCAFAHNEGVFPFTSDVFNYTARELKPFVDPRLILMAEKNGTPIAFSFLLPDINEFLKSLNGSMGILDLVRLPFALRRIRSAVILLVGAAPEAQGTGVGRLLASEMFRSIVNSKYERVVTTWVHQDNYFPRVLARGFNFRTTKRYLILGKEALPDLG